MAIILFSGTPGTGKTLSVMEFHLLKSLREGRKVYHNIRGVNLHKICAFLDLEYYDLKKLCVYIGEEEGDINDYFKNVEPGSLSIIDEAHSYMSGEKYRSLSHLKQFISLHRHNGNDVILITQHPDDIWSTIIKRVEQTHYLKKHPTKGAEYYKEYIYAKFKIEGEALIEHTRKQNQKIFPLYQSRQFTQKKEINLRASPWQNPQVRFKIGVAVFCIILMIVVISINGVPLMVHAKDTSIEADSLKADKTKIKKENSKNDTLSLLHRVGEFQNIVIPYSIKKCSRGYCDFIASDGSRVVYPKFILDNPSEYPIRFKREYDKK